MSLLDPEVFDLTKNLHAVEPTNGKASAVIVSLGGNRITVCCSARQVLWYLVFFGFAVNYMLRVNLNIAIVSMVQKRIETIVQAECFSKEDTLVNITESSENELQLSPYKSEREESEVVLNRTRRQMNETDDGKSTFDWNEKEQGMVLGAFHWLHWVTQIPGGVLGNRYGTKVVFGLANFSGALMCFLMPIASKMGYAYLIALRLIQGLVTGLAWPSMHCMVAKWIPPNERSKFITAYLGSSVGAAMTFPMCGFIIDRWGWEYAFHACGILGILWFTSWWLLAHDSPSQHPRVTEKERSYIESSLGGTVAKKRTASIPWCKMLSSTPLMMNVLAQIGGTYGLYTGMTHAPTYFKVVHGWSIKNAGILSGLPHIMRMIFALVCSSTGDYLLKSGKIGKTCLRKVATGICTIGQGVCMMAVAHSGCDHLAAIIFLTAATAVNGAVSTGPLASLVDIAPNYASVSLGIVNTASGVTGFVVPTVVGYLTFENQSVGQWQKVFWVATAVLTVCGIFYILFSSSEIQSWNNPDADNEKCEEKLMTDQKFVKKEKKLNDTTTHV